MSASSFVPGSSRRKRRSSSADLRSHRWPLFLAAWCASVMVAPRLGSPTLGLLLRVRAAQKTRCGTPGSPCCGDALTYRRAAMNGNPLSLSFAFGTLAPRLERGSGQANPCDLVDARIASLPLGLTPLQLARAPVHVAPWGEIRGALAGPPACSTSPNTPFHASAALCARPCRAGIERVAFGKGADMPVPCFARLRHVVNGRNVSRNGAQRNERNVS
jgi:hypothetical protein